MAAIMRVPFDLTFTMPERNPSAALNFAALRESGTGTGSRSRWPGVWLSGFLALVVGSANPQVEWWEEE